MNPPATAGPPALLLLGPTASGKTACALALAQVLPIEIISVDSAQIYRHMDVGTAKPSHTERAVCPHHLIDVISPEQRYSAARFCTDALRLIDEIHARERIPLLTGGTMLYFKALRDGLSDLPHADRALRQTIDHEAAQRGWPAMHDELARLDAQAAARLAPTDAQRIQRALEIVRLTGRPLADSYAARRPAPTNGPRWRPIALAASDRACLHRRIELRFEQMLADGLIEEVRALREMYTLEPGLPSMRCVGYRQVWDYLDGLDTYDAMRFKGIAATRQLAKRQLTWQRQFRETWHDWIEFDCAQPHLTEAVLSAARQLLD